MVMEDVHGASVGQNMDVCIIADIHGLVQLFHVTYSASLYSGPLLLDAFLLDHCKSYMQSCTNDMTNRNMSTIVIWSFFTKLETDASKAQYVFIECVLSCMVV